MDVREFTEAAGWLRERQVSDGIGRSRTELGTHLGWPADWYEQDENLAELFGFLERNRPEVLDGLDELTGAGDGDEREEWIAQVADLANPALRYQEPIWDDNYGLWYRYDNVGQVYEWAQASPDAPPDAAVVWMSQQEADALVKQSAAAEEARPPGEEAYSEPEWDENWQMLYRTGPGGVYLYAYSDDRKTPRPGTGWLSYDQVMQETQVTAAEEAASQVVDEILPDALTELAEQVPGVRLLTPEQLQSLVSRVVANQAAAVPVGAPPGQQ